MDTKACFDELQKLGAVSTEQAQSALNRLDTLERNKATPQKAARYAAAGAVAAPLVSGVANAIKGKGFRGGLKGVAHIRDVLGDATKGAIGTGALPVIHQHLDRKAEEHTLRKFLKENPT